MLGKVFRSDGLTKYVCTHIYHFVFSHDTTGPGKSIAITGYCNNIDCKAFEIELPEQAGIAIELFESGVRTTIRFDA